MTAIMPGCGGDDDDRDRPAQAPVGGALRAEAVPQDPKPFALIVQPIIRPAMRKLVKTCLPDTPVMSFTEVPDDKSVEVVANEGKQNVMSVSLERLPGGEIALFYLVKNSLVDCRPSMRISRDEAKTPYSE